MVPHITVPPNHSLEGHSAIIDTAETRHWAERYTLGTHQNFMETDWVVDGRPTSSARYVTISTPATPISNYRSSLNHTETCPGAGRNPPKMTLMVDFGHRVAYMVSE